MPYKHRDPQIVVEGEFKQTERSDIIVFEFPLGPAFVIVCIVTVPPEGTDRAPVYVKFKVNRSKKNGSTHTYGDDHE